MKKFIKVLIITAVASYAAACSVIPSSDKSVSRVNEYEASPTQSFALKDANLDTFFPRAGDNDLTSGSIVIDQVAQTLKISLLFDLFPQFYEVKIDQIKTDDCGSGHYFGKNEAPLGNDLEHTIYFVNHLGSHCANGPRTLYAVLQTILFDGTETNSYIYFTGDHLGKP